jgi:hypothetical protein
MSSYDSPASRHVISQPEAVILRTMLERIEPDSPRDFSTIDTSDYLSCLRRYWPHWTRYSVLHWIRRNRKPHPGPSGHRSATSIMTKIRATKWNLLARSPVRGSQHGYSGGMRDSTLNDRGDWRSKNEPCENNPSDERCRG